MIDNIKHCLMRRCAIYVADAAQNGRTITHITDDLNQINRVLRMSQLATALSEASGDLFSVGKRISGHAYLVPLIRPLHLNYLDVFEFSREPIREFFPRHRLSPKVEAYLDLVGRSEELLSYYKNSRGQSDYAFILRYCELLNRFADEFRDRVSSSECIKKDKNQSRLVNSNIASARSFLGKMFSLEPGALVVVMDLYCEGVPYVAGEATEEFSFSRKRRDQFFRLIRKKAKVLGVIGYLWRLEYSRFKGYYYTTVFLFRANVLGQLESIIADIGEMWTNVEFVSGQYGCWFVDPTISSDAGEELISGGSVERKSNIEDFVVGLLKSDCHFRVSIDSRYPVFMTGECDITQLK